MTLASPLFKRNDPAGFAASQLLGAYSQAFRRSVSKLQKRLSAEEIHEVRIDTRRLQVILKVFKKWLPLGTQKLSEDLRWLRHQMDETRDLHVQRKMLESVGDQTLEHKLSRRTARASSHLRGILHSRRCKTLLRVSMLITGKQPLKIGKRAIKIFRHGVRKLITKFKKRHGDDVTDQELHQQRKDLKKLRYTLEAFDWLLPRVLKKILKRAKKLANVLGDYQDLVVLEALEMPAYQDYVQTQKRVLSKVYAKKSKHFDKTLKEAKAWL